MLLNLPSGLGNNALSFLRVDDMARAKLACRRCSLGIRLARLTVRSGTTLEELVHFGGFAQIGNVVLARGALYRVICRIEPGFNHILLDEVISRHRVSRRRWSDDRPNGLDESIWKAAAKDPRSMELRKVPIRPEDV